MRFLFFILLLLPALAMAEAAPRWEHALTLFGSPKYPAWFHHYDYTNPSAPKGGKVKLMNPATFDSLNQYILKGIKAPGLSYLNETLMTAAMDEPQTYYPLLARDFRRDPKGKWIEFRLNPLAHWNDGKPITAEDVAWSLETIKTEADPIYRLSFAPLKKVKIINPHQVKFFFAKPIQREAALIAAALPILPSHYYLSQWERSKSAQTISGEGEKKPKNPHPHRLRSATSPDGRGENAKVLFNKTTLTAPLGSGPYRIKSVEPGRNVVYERVKDYWGRDLPVNRGKYNFDEIRFDVYRDATVALEAFKAGEYDLRQENIARNWATAYDTPALKDGRMIKVNIPNEIPQGMQAFFYNLRKPYFHDRRVREAISLTMDFEWSNKTLFYGAYKRNLSFFQFTPFAATNQLPGPRETAMLEPFREILPPDLFTESFTLATTDGSGQNRKNLLRAQALLDEAGLRLKDGKRLDPLTGEPLRIEFLLNQVTMQRVILPMRKGLKQLGIEASIRIVDDSQYQQRVDTRDFDIISGWINLGVFFPGVEQMNTWHSSQATIDGSNNVSGLTHPAVDKAVEAINKAHTLEELIPAGRALDRVLMWEHVVIPHWYNGSFRTAYWSKFGKPATDPKYGFAFDAWWVRPAKK